MITKLTYPPSWTTSNILIPFPPQDTFWAQQTTRAACSGLVVIVGVVVGAVSYVPAGLMKAVINGQVVGEAFAMVLASSARKWIRSSTLYLRP